MSKKDELFITSIYYTEAGPFTKEELAARASKRLFTWDMYILRMGEKTWYPVREIPDLRVILEDNLPLRSRDAGPAGGFVLLTYAPSLEPVEEDTQGKRYVEAAPFDVGFASWHEAGRLCNEFSHNGYTDWRLPTEVELRELGKCLNPYLTYRTTEILRHWSGVQKGDEAVAVVTQENKDYYQVHQHYPPTEETSGGYYVSKNGPWIGDKQTFPVTHWFYVRPVRDFYHKKCGGSIHTEYL